MTMEIDGIEYLAAAEAAQHLSTTDTRILMLLKQNELDGELLDGEWFVTTASLACYDKHAKKAEKQLQCRTSCGSSGCGCH